MEFSSIVKEKDKILDKLSDLEKTYKSYLKLDETFTENAFLIEKIKTVHDNISNDKFIIAMFGAFSDGKSTIIKALTNEENIEISPEPTTSEVVSYHINNDDNGSVKIVDTPGLFSENDIHSETTKLYISEANVILYAIDAENPIKESQSETLSWLLNDLDKIDSTLFIINKMDSVVDIEEESDFDQSASIKIEEVFATVKKINNNVEKSNIIPMSADPYGMGLDYWKNEHHDEYRSLSRVNNLKLKLNGFTKQYNYSLIQKAGNSVINDIVEYLNKDIEDTLTVKKELIELEMSQLENIEKQIENFLDEIRISHNNIQEELEAYRKSIITGIMNTQNQKELNDYFTLEIGEDGYLISKEIEKIIEKHTKTLIENQKLVIEDIENSATSYNEKREKLMDYSQNFSKKAASAISQLPNKSLSTSILKLRDTFNIPVKFKPWGAVNLAKKIKVGNGILVVGLDAFNSYSESKKQNEWEKLLNSEIDKMASFFKNIDAQLDKEEYIKNYFPMVGKYYTQIKESRELIDSLGEDVKSLNKYNKKFNSLKSY